MATIGQARRRAVRLTHEGIEVLSQRLIEDWSSRPRQGKLTREARAERLGLSVVTTDRILKGAGVDRSSLITAFSSLGLVWDDSYCRPVEVAREAVLESESTRPESKRIWRSVVSTVGALAVITACYIGLRPLTVHADEDPIGRWQKEFASLMTKAVDDYYAGNYGSARSLLRKAKRMAVEFREVSAIAWTTRVEADLEAERGDWIVALDKYERARVLYEAVGALDGVAAVLEATADIELRTDKLLQARAHYLEFHRLALSRRDYPGTASAHRGLGSVASKSGQNAVAKEHFQTALNVFSDRPDDNMAVDIRARLAMVWAEEGDTARADKVLAACLRHWEAQRHVRWTSTTRLQMARVARKAGDEGRARNLAVLARRGFEEVHDRAGTDDCETFLGSARRP